MGYSRRLIDDELDALLPALPAIALDGPKGVGKTATASRRAATALALDTPETLQIIEAAPERVTKADRPVLIDEWQRFPPLWDLVRRSVDQGAPPGSFLLTGSATPQPGVTIHSGAGRILSLRMRPMALCERSLVRPTVSLGDLLSPDGPTEISGSCPLSLTDYAAEIEASGLPGIRELPSRARRAQLDSYLTRALSKELADEQNATVRRPHSLRAWVVAYAAATSSTASWESVRRAANPGDPDPPSKVTSIRYRDWLTALWLLDPLPAWSPQGVTLKGLMKSPKHHLADPALAARLLRVTASSLLSNGALADPRPGTHLGPLFESLATLTVRACAQSAEANTSHLRTQRGEREVDIVVEGADGRIVGVEVKLSRTITDRDVRHLLWLRDALGSKTADLVVLTTGTQAYRRKDGVAVVPLGLLGP